MEMGAIFDRSGRYRYMLWRSWNLDAARIVFVMLNPSTADAYTDDATLCRCTRFAQSWGYGALEVVNLFALVATRPQALQQAVDPVGAECDRHLLTAASRGDRIIVAWGNWGKLQQRDRTVLTLLATQQRLYCLGVNQSGQPRHPLYLKKDSEPIDYPV